jgi:hypothetical protein
MVVTGAALVLVDYRYFKETGLACLPESFWITAASREAIH